MTVFQLVSNKTWGGGERYALDLALALRADGHDVAVFTRRTPAVKDKFVTAGLLKATLPLGGPLDIISPLRLASALNHTKGPVVIHTHNFKDARTAVAARRLARSPENIRVVVTRHLVRPAKTDASHQALYKAIDRIAFVSDLARRVFLSAAPAVDPSRLVTILNAIPPSTAPAATPGRADGPVNIIYAGRIHPEKGLDTLLQALSELPEGADWHLTICGTGASTDVMPLVRKSRALGLEPRIEWLGHVDDTAPLLASAHIAVIPSIVPEACSLTVIEAMRAGVAVVASDNGSQPEMISSGTDGILLPPSDHKALSATLASLIHDPARREALGKAAYNTWTQKFKYNRFYRQIIDMYNGR